MKDYYKILKVNKTSTIREIQSSYRKLAKMFHPDSNKDDAKSEQVFKEIGEAYAVLSDKERKEEYDFRLANYNSSAADTGKKSSSKACSRYMRTSSAVNQVDFSNMNNAFSSFFGFDPATGKTNMEDDEIKPMNTKDAFAHIFGFRNSK